MKYPTKIPEVTMNCGRLAKVPLWEGGDISVIYTTMVLRKKPSPIPLIARPTKS